MTSPRSSERPTSSRRSERPNRRADPSAGTSAAPEPAEPSTDVAAAHDAALRFLAQRPRSEDEVRRRLQRQRVADATIDQVLERLRAVGLVDDDAFARYWLEQRQTFRPRGARLLQLELRQHGIAADVATSTTDELVTSAEDDAYRAAQKRARTLSTTDEHVFKTRLGQFLARRGFDWATVATVVNRLWLEISTS